MVSSVLERGLRQQLEHLPFGRQRQILGCSRFGIYAHKRRSYCNSPARLRPGDLEEISQAISDGCERLICVNNKLDFFQTHIMINTIKIAVLLIRAIGLQFILVGVLYLTYLPERIFMANHAISFAAVGAAHLETRMLIGRFSLHILLGVLLMYFASPIGKSLASGLEEN